MDIVVGVVAEHVEQISTFAARFAQRLDAGLTFAFVEPRRCTTEVLPGGEVMSRSSYADDVTERVEVFSEDLRESIGAVMQGSGVPWTTRARAGQPAQELERLADELDASMIIVGSRRRGAGGRLHEMWDGSAAVGLARGSTRVVVIVPLGGPPGSTERGRR